jgi:hypothetical protein
MVGSGINNVELQVPFPTTVRKADKDSGPWKHA